MPAPLAAKNNRKLKTEPGPLRSLANRTSRFSSSTFLIKSMLCVEEEEEGEFSSFLTKIEQTNRRQLIDNVPITWETFVCVSIRCIEFSNFRKPFTRFTNEEMLCLLSFR